MQCQDLVEEDAVADSEEAEEAFAAAGAFVAEAFAADLRAALVPQEDLGFTAAFTRGGDFSAEAAAPA